MSSNHPFPIDRRSFVAATTATLATVAFSACQHLTSSRDEGIIDTHTHFYDPRRPQGVPWPDKNGKSPPSPWIEGMRKCARHPNVFCKVSALVEGTSNNHGDAPASVEFYRATLEVVWEAFGEDRLVYGSNWPVSARFAPYERIQSIVADYFREKGSTASDKYFRENAKRIYRYVA